MKITTTATFHPITIIIESQQELDMFGTLFNCAAVCAALKQMGLLKNNATTYDDLRIVGADISRVKEFLNELKNGTK